MEHKNESPFACDLRVLSKEGRDRVLQLLASLKGDVEEFREIENGYEFRFSTSMDLVRIAEFISYERLCCPFFDFALIVERETGPMRLCLTGREGVKEFIRFEFGL